MPVTFNSSSRLAKDPGLGGQETGTLQPTTSTTHRDKVACIQYLATTMYYYSRMGRLNTASNYGQVTVNIHTHCSKKVVWLARMHPPHLWSWLSCETKREEVSGVCRLSEVRRGEARPSDRGGGDGPVLLLPPVAIHCSLRVETYIHVISDTLKLAH